MYLELNKSQFRDLFHTQNRQGTFSYEALGALYDYLSEAEFYSVDVIGLCCEWTEVNPCISEELGTELSDKERQDYIDELEKHTTVLVVNQNVVLYHLF